MPRTSHFLLTALLCGCVLAAVIAPAEARPFMRAESHAPAIAAAAATTAPVADPTQDMLTDYREAMDKATAEHKMLFIYFHEPGDNAACHAFETQVLADSQIQQRLEKFVVVRLPRDTTIQVDGKDVTLLKHSAFSEMLGRQGVAVIDLEHQKPELYGRVVSTFPFSSGKYYTKQALQVILDLPAGTLTQRTMVFAVRMHPEAPASTQGEQHHALVEEAKLSSTHQANILVQGHHSWDARFHRISSKLPSGLMAQEVVAESWPNESLVEACVDCVDSWRQSPGHWNAVRSRHPVFGYDIQRGRNGIWYATGLFGRR